MASAHVRALLLLAALGPWVTSAEESCTPGGVCAASENVEGGGSKLLQQSVPRLEDFDEETIKGAWEAWWAAKTSVDASALQAYDSAIAAGATANGAHAAANAAGRAAASARITHEQFTALFLSSQASCPSADHSADLDRPITEVRAEHPDQRNLFCHFSKHVFWFRNCHNIYALRNYVMSHEDVRLAQEGFSGSLPPDGTGPLVTFHMEGLPPEGLTAHIDGTNYFYDDLYCYVLGFLQNQGLDGRQMFEFDAWEEAGRQWCARAAQEAKEFNYSDEELTIRNHVDVNPVIVEASECAAGRGPEGCKPVTRRMFILHAYQKCLVGDESPEMTYCFVRGCLRGNHIGHFAECD